MPTDQSNAGVKGDYKFYDENFKPMWNRGISRKIGESSFVQQTLPTYRLSWSPLKICPMLLLMGALFIGMGVGIRKFANGIQEVKLPYTNCSSIERPGQTCYKVLENATKRYAEANGKLAIFNVDANEIENCTCNVHFRLEETLKGTVYIYYSLTNFYQNHLGYYVSRDENQLKGNLFKKDGEPKDPSSACKPMDKDGMQRIIYPCGIMANSMFTDVIDLTFHPPETAPPELIKFGKNGTLKHSETSQEEIDGKVKDVYRNQIQVMNLSVPLMKTGIAWESDRMDKYAYPDEFYNAKNTIWANYAKPYGWKKSLWHLDPHNMSNNGVLNEDFIVWMRAAAFPYFRKLHRIVDSQMQPFKNGLPVGDYTLRIEYNYDVSSFNGEKEIILTNSAMVAGKNVFLSIVYMATGGVCIFLSFLLFIVYKWFGVSKSQLTISSIKQD